MSHERTLFRQDAPPQSIHLFEEDDGALGLTLDGYWQFHSRDEGPFHQMLAETPICVTASPRRVLILGGGDGLALRNVLLHPEVESVTLCELDPRMIEMTGTVPQMRSLTGDALADPRVQVHIADARKYLTERPGLFDVVICDFPSPTHDALIDLFSASFFASLAAALSEEGTMMTQVSAEPRTFWPILEQVADVFSWQAPLLLDLGHDGEEENWADFILASRAPRGTQRPVRSLNGPLAHHPWTDHLITNRSGSTFITRAYGRESYDE